MKTILIPLPCVGFDPSEAAIPWQLFCRAGFKVMFTTPNGEQAVADQRMLFGTDLGILTSVLAARQDAVDACLEMQSCPEFCSPLAYNDVNEAEFDALLLPGGHDKAVKDYLESTVLQTIVVEFFNHTKPVAAVCHGVVVAARSIDPRTGHSVIHGYKTTSLLKSQELLGYNLTRLWLGDYYLTYPEITVEDEVRRALCDRNNFIKGPPALFRDSPDKLARGFVVKDRHYLSARWPGDVYTLSFEFIKMINAQR